MDKLQKMDAIEPVDGPTDWVSPVVVVPKGEEHEDEIRMVLDMRKPNTAIRRNHKPVPTLDEMLEKFNGCTVFSKLDLRHGYHQIELHPDSRHITTFSTHIGLFRYKRLVQGANSALEEYQHLIGNLFIGVDHVGNISDDLLVGGVDQEEHDNNLEKALCILKENNLTLNKNKCEFDKKNVEFFGFNISGEGIRPTQSKVAAIKAFPAPTNATECRSFLGLINYLGRFIPNLSSETELLRKLTEKGVKWDWTVNHDKVFANLKALVSSRAVVAHFNQSLETYLIVDAGPVGLGGILAQKQIDNSIRPVAYASKTLTKTEQR